MKIVGLEEHFLTPEIAQAWEKNSLGDSSQPKATLHQAAKALFELGPERIAAMDAVGMGVQVLSVTTPALQSLPADEAVKLQRLTNDQLAKAVKQYPDRFQGFASLATPAPAEAARELERTVKELGFAGAMLCGRTQDKNLDHPDFEALFAKAAELRAPLYIHPQAPIQAIQDQYYRGINPEVDDAFSTFGLGWHYEAGIQILRLVLNGTFDRHPDLQLITGHWGEVVLFYLERIEGLASKAKLKHSIQEYFRRNISITPSGILSHRYLRWAKEVIGVERILFALDYPFVPLKAKAATDFLAAADLTEAEKEAIAHKNWERLLGNVRR